MVFLLKLLELTLTLTKRKKLNTSTCLNLWIESIARDKLVGVRSQILSAYSNLFRINLTTLLLRKSSEKCLWNNKRIPRQNTYLTWWSFNLLRSKEVPWKEVRPHSCSKLIKGLPKLTYQSNLSTRPMRLSLLCITSSEKKMGHLMTNLKILFMASTATKQTLEVGKTQDLVQEETDQFLVNKEVNKRSQESLIHQKWLSNSNNLKCKSQASRQWNQMLVDYFWK